MHVEKVRLFSVAFNPTPPSALNSSFSPVAHSFSAYTLCSSHNPVSLQMSPLDSLQTPPLLPSLHVLVVSFHHLPEMLFFSCSHPYLSLEVWFKCYHFHEAFPDPLAGGNSSLSEH